MNQNNPREIWKPVQFDFEFTNQCTIEVSNLGRIRTFNKLSDGNILNGSMIKGYRIIRLKFYSPRDTKTANTFVLLNEQVLNLAKKIRELKKEGAPDAKVEEMTQLLQSMKRNVSKKFQADLKSRTIHYHSLVHKLVAEYFCEKPSEKHTVVAHLDYNKMNNNCSNLKWMTPAENVAHQQKSPLVIAAKKERAVKAVHNPTNAKLTITKVMLLKKLLNNGKPIRTLVKQFKVTETQILRIKRGENWGHIQAAT